MRKKVILLIDGDIVAYQQSATNERTYDLDGEDIVAVDFDECIDGARSRIDEWAKQLKADQVIVCLSDDFNNYREKVLPSYKGNRSGTRPSRLYDLKKAMAEHYDTELWPNVEADDVMGILSTSAKPDEKIIIISDDKDMKTIPGWFMRPLEPNAKPKLISPEDATRYFLSQVITGDATDNYKGCPGAGPAAAEEILNGTMMVMIERTLKSGPRKGTVLQEWHKKEAPEVPVWDRIVSLYESKGCTEEDAIVQARCAFILHNTHWDGSKPILWNPPER